MSMLQSIAQLQKKFEGLRRKQWPGFQPLSQARSIHKFHRKIEEIARQSEIVDANYIPMTQFFQQLRLTFKTVIPVNNAATIGGPRLHDFQRHDAVKAVLAPFKDRSHSSSANKFNWFENSTHHFGKRFKRRRLKSFNALRRWPFQSLFQQTIWTRTGQNPRVQNNPALRTLFFVSRSHAKLSW